MGPSAFRTAGLVTELRNLGYAVEDRGNIMPGPLRDLRHPNPAVKALPETVAWTEAIAEAAYRASGAGTWTGLSKSTMRPGCAIASIT